MLVGLRYSTKRLSVFQKIGVRSDKSHIPPHGPKGAGSKRRGSNPEWLVMNRGKKKWATDCYQQMTSMSLEASTCNPMYTTQLYKSVSFPDGGKCD